MFISVLPVLFVVAQSSGLSDKCIGPKDVGERCTDGNKEAVQWYYDNETEICVAFKYNGCGGNQNRFSEYAECQQTCLPLHDNFCSLHKSPLSDDKGQPVICSGKVGNIQKCPDGYLCKTVVFIGACCPKASEALYERNIFPKCTNGNIVKIGNTETNLLGKSCGDKFCPIGAQCMQQELTAFCCQRN